MCLTCGTLFDDTNSRICPECWASLITVGTNDPTWQEIHGKLITEGPVEQFASCYLFEKEGKLQEIIHLLKYQGKKSLGIELGRKLGTIIRHSPCMSSVDYILPVPLHPLKKRERGYNQSEFICRGISEITGIPTHPTLIIRRKYTQSQTQLTLQQRKLNVGDAFKIRPKMQAEARARRFIIVDDVITTGSTINACAGVLRFLGAEKVFAASIAIAK